MVWEQYAQHEWQESWNMDQLNMLPLEYDASTIRMIIGATKLRHTAQQPMEAPLSSVWVYFKTTIYDGALLSSFSLLTSPSTSLLDTVWLLHWDIRTMPYLWCESRLSSNSPSIPVCSGRPSAFRQRLTITAECGMWADESCPSSKRGPGRLTKLSWFGLSKLPKMG